MLSYIQRRPVFRAIAIVSLVLVQVPVSGDEFVSDLPLYYSLGGSRASPPPANPFSSLGQFGTESSLADAFCGNFNPAGDITEMLSSRLTDSLAALSSFPLATTSALPGYILCRAKPGMCQLLQHYVVRAEQKWNIAVKSCEETVQDLADGKSPLHGWVQLSKAQTWQTEAQSGASAAEAKESADRTDGCVNWLGGKRAGCKGKEPIWPTRDAVQAGWCLLHKSSGDCTAADHTEVSDFHLDKVWASPTEASEWVTDVVGDYKVHIGENEESIAGAGLLTKVEEEAEGVNSQLTQLVYASNTPKVEELRELSSAYILLTPEVVAALRDLPDRNFLIARLANEIALSRTINKAFLARRLLLSGRMEPNIQTAGVSDDTLKEKIQLLEQEIEYATFELQVGRRLVADTTVHILNAHQTLMTPTPPTTRTPGFSLK